jgi:hypothetical protein
VVDGATLLSYVDGGRAMLAELTDDGVAKLPVATGGTNQPWVDHVTGIVGRFPDPLWLTYEDGGRCIMRAAALRFAGGAWKPAFDLGEQDNIVRAVPYQAGAIGLHDCVDACGTATAGCTSGTLWSDALARTPPLTAGGVVLEDVAALPSGEIYAVGSVCSQDRATCTASQLRWWSPGAKVLSATFPRTDGSRASVLARSPTDVIVAQGRDVYAFDGAKIKKLSTVGAGIYELLDRGAGGVWARGDKLFAVSPDGTSTDITPPKVGRSGWLHVAAKGDEAWASHGDALYRWQAGAWRSVELPRPPFSSTRAYLSPGKVVVRGPGEVYVVADYHERQPGWNDIEHRVAILSTKRPRETLRCRLEPNGVDSTMGGLLAWPAPATEACTTPLVVLAPVSPASPKGFDYPKTRAALRPHLASIAGGEIIEIREDDVVWIAARATSVDAAHKIAETYARTFPTTRTEVVCATPEPTRTIPIDPKAKDGGP